MCKNAHMTDWDDLRFVLATVREGGVSGAARLLGVNHATVSRRITAIEQRLGVRLFDRMQSGFEPTDAGLEALKAGEDMEAAMLKMSRDLAGRDNRLGGSVTLTAPLMVLMGPLAPILADFRRDYPLIELNLIGTNDVLNLHRRDADIAIRLTNHPSEGLFGARLVGQRAAVYAAPGYIADLGDSDSLDWIGHLGQRQPAREILDVYPNSRIVLRAQDKLAAQAAVRMGMGACRLPCFEGDTDVTLARVPGFDTFDYPDFWILTHRDLRDAARIRVLLRHISAAVKHQRDLFMGERPRPQ